MGFYDFADYSELDSLRKVLFWYDEYLRHDLLFLHLDNFLAILVEKATIHNYNYCDYSSLLFDIATQTNTFNQVSDNPLIGVDFTINYVPQPESKPVILTYYTISSPRITIAKRLSDFGSSIAVPNSTHIRIVKHFRILRREGRYAIKKVLPYSLLVSNNTDNIESLIPNNCLFKNRQQWFNNVEPLKSVKKDVDTHFFYATRSVDGDTYDGDIMFNPMTNDISYETFNFVTRSEPYYDFDYSKPFITNYSGVTFEEYKRVASTYPAIGYKWNLNVRDYWEPTEDVRSPLGGYTAFIPLSQKTRIETINQQSLGNRYKSPPTLTSANTISGERGSNTSDPDLTKIYHCRLIRARPQPNLLEGKLTNDTTLSDRKYGFEVSDSKVIHLLEYFSIRTQLIVGSKNKIGENTSTVMRLGEGDEPHRLAEGVNAVTLTFQKQFGGTVDDVATQVKYTTRGNTVQSKVQYFTVFVQYQLEFNSVDFEDYIANFAMFSNINITNITNFIDQKIRQYTTQYKNNPMSNNNPLGYELMIQEIHACLGAREYAYQDIQADELEERVTNIGWLVNRIALALGISYKPNGDIMPIRQRRNIKYTENTATIPQGWGRGQFSVNKGGGTNGQIGGEQGEDRLGIVYQNRCNRYENFSDDDQSNNEIARGDLVLCENLPQFIESYLEDLDKGLNWQEMGTGVLPNADRTGFCTYEGMGTLLAEVAYMLSQLSGNIMESHSLNLMTFSTTLEILKGMGIPTGVGRLEMDIGVTEDIGEEQPATLLVPKISEDAPTLTAQMMNLLSNIAIIIGGLSDITEEQEETVEE